MDKNKYELIEVKEVAKNIRHIACEIIVEEKNIYDKTPIMTINDFISNCQHRIMNIKFDDVDVKND